MALKSQEMVQILQRNWSPKLNPIVQKCLPNLYNNLNWYKIFTIVTRLDLESNLSSFNKIRYSTK